MKALKPLFLVSIIPLLLGCSGKKYIGTYVFQMGKSKDTHMGISLQLMNEFYNPEEEELGKKYQLDVDMVTSQENDDFTSVLKEMSPVTGYYSVDEQEKVYDAKRLKMGIDLLGQYHVPDELTDLIFVANINSTTVNFFLPVSVTDLIYQLYWYGYDLNLTALISGDESYDPLNTKEGKHDIGTHPTKEDIDRINTHYKDDHAGVAFRDYHVLKLGLTKI